MLEGSATVQKDQDELEKRPAGNLVKLSEGKWKALHLGFSNPMHHYKLSNKWVKSSFTQKDLQDQVANE